MWIRESMGIDNQRYFFSRNKSASAISHRSHRLSHAVSREIFLMMWRRESMGEKVVLVS
jgi:hypothetical protein